MNTQEYDFDMPHDMNQLQSMKWSFYPSDIIPMWIADSDFLCPTPIINAVTARAMAGIYGYPMAADPFKKAVQQWMQTRFAWQIATEHVSYCYTVLSALCDIIRAFTEPQEKVLIMSPVYHPFHHIIEGVKRTKVTTSLQENNGYWTIDFDDFEAKLADPAVKLLLLCSPHNPCGRVFTREELERINELCLRHNVLVAADEMHGDIVFAPHKQIPFATISAQAAQNSITLISSAKTFNTPGLRTAAAITPNADIRARFEKGMFDNKTADVSLMGLVATQSAFTECASYLDELLVYLQKNIDYAVHTINNDIPKLRTIAPEGTYLLWIDCRELGMSSKELMQFMLEKAKVAMSNGRDFGIEGEGFMRMNIACRHATLQEALTRIKQAIIAG